MIQETYLCMLDIKDPISDMQWFPKDAQCSGTSVKAIFHFLNFVQQKVPFKFLRLERHEPLGGFMASFTPRERGLEYAHRIPACHMR